MLPSATVDNQQFCTALLLPSRAMMSKSRRVSNLITVAIIIKELFNPLEESPGIVAIFHTGLTVTVAFLTGVIHTALAGALILRWLGQLIAH